MKHSNRIQTGIFFIFFFLVMIPSIGFAYIDPGTGSYFIQILIAALAGGVFALKMFWKKIMASLKIRKNKKTEPDSVNE